ncbi:MAG: peptidase MA family metallohydrolase [Candidatus Riflebacteria bacterium]|nr:peptidase MA family metallohydrolase [Candidatus Riflebacteria bacterium]
MLRKTIIGILFAVIASSVCLAQTVRVEYFRDPLMPVTEELANKLEKLTITQIDKTIEKSRPIAFGDTPREDIKHNLAAFLIRKIILLQNKPYETLEPLFLEADKLMPNNYNIEIIWGDILCIKSNFEEALAHYDNAAYLEPTADTPNTSMYTKAGFAAATTMKYDKAIEYFDKVLAVKPDDYTALMGGGTAHFELKNFYETVEYLEKAVQIAPTEPEKIFIERILAQAKEFLASTESSTTDEDQRFIIHFAGDSRDDIGDVTFDMLEEIFFQVTDSLNFHPDVKINVIFFLTQDYYKIGKEWSAAAAQGIQIMVPLKSGYKTPEYVKGLLAHEFTHTIIHLKTKNRCPLWLNEGLAQYQEFTASYGSADIIRPDFEGILQREFIEEQNNITLSKAQSLIQSGTNNTDVARGYIASYMAVRCLADYYGEQSFDELLSELGEGKTIDEAMVSVTGRNMPDFENEFSDWLSNL